MAQRHGGSLIPVLSFTRQNLHCVYDNFDGDGAFDQLARQLALGSRIGRSRRPERFGVLAKVAEVVLWQISVLQNGHYAALTGAPNRAKKHNIYASVVSGYR